MELYFNVKLNFLEYSAHIENIQDIFPELDLLKDSEFDIFENKEFALNFIRSCIDFTNNARNQLNIDLYFGVEFNYTFNGSARIKNNTAVILVNLGLIEKIDLLITTSRDLFLRENIAIMTIDKDYSEKLKPLLVKSCIIYIYYHELAHVIQLLEIDKNSTKNFHEKYVENKSFNIKNHIYEFDADLFGSMISASSIMNFVMDKNYEFSSLNLFNSLTAIIFTKANILIQFSNDKFDEIYIKNFSHPHPFIRIVKISEQILGNISNNTQIDNSFFEASLQRAATMVSQISYENGLTLDYADFYNKNSDKIGEYISEIENANKNYRELTRFKPQEFYNKFIN